MALVVVLALAGCGDDGAQEPPAAPPSPAAPSPAPTPPRASAPRAPEPPSDAPAPAPGPEEMPGGAGDEQAVYVPATFTVERDGVHPRRVSVPAFLQIELQVVNRTAAARDVVLRAPRRVRLAVPAGARRAMRVPGQRPGRYRVDLGGGARATLIVGAEPGP